MLKSVYVQNVQPQVLGMHEDKRQLYASARKCTAQAVPWTVLYSHSAHSDILDIHLVCEITDHILRQLKNKTYSTVLYRLFADKIYVSYKYFYNNYTR